MIKIFENLINLLFILLALATAFVVILFFSTYIIPVIFKSIDKSSKDAITYNLQEGIIGEWNGIKGHIVKFTSSKNVILDGEFTGTYDLKDNTIHMTFSSENANIGNLFADFTFSSSKLNQKNYDSITITDGNFKTTKPDYWNGSILKGRLTFFKGDFVRISNGNPKYKMVNLADFQRKEERR